MSEPAVARLLPPQTELAAPFWQGCRAGELRLQHCAACDRFQFYPRIVCTGCGATPLAWQAVSGRGRIASFTVVRRALSAAYEAPYVVALIDLEEGPRLMSNIVDTDVGAVAGMQAGPTDEWKPARVEVGARVEVQFEPWGADWVLPVFRVAHGDQLGASRS